MVRVTHSQASRRRHKSILKAAKGYRGAIHRRFKVANEAVMHARYYATVHRRLKKRQMRAMNIIVLNAAVRQHGTTYGQFIYKLKKTGIEIDRKILAEMAIENPESLANLVEKVR